MKDSSRLGAAFAALPGGYVPAVPVCASDIDVVSHTDLPENPEIFMSSHQSEPEVPPLQTEVNQLHHNNEPSVTDISVEADNEKVTRKRRKRCGECPGCQTKDNCGKCGPCKSVRSHQVCKMRKCAQLKKVKELIRHENTYMMPNQVNELNKSSNSSANSRPLFDTNSSFSSIPPPPPHRFVPSIGHLTPVNSMTSDRQQSSTYNFEHRNSTIRHFMNTRFNDFISNQVNPEKQDHMQNYISYHVDENAYSDATSPLTPHLSSSESDSFTQAVKPVQNEIGNNLRDKTALDAQSNYTSQFL